MLCSEPLLLTCYTEFGTVGRFAFVHMLLVLQRGLGGLSIMLLKCEGVVRVSFLVPYFARQAVRQD